MMQKASLLYANGRPTVEVLDLLNAGTVQYLMRSGFVSPTGRRVTSLNLWSISRGC